jgi:hypothetical protein
MAELCKYSDLLNKKTRPTTLEVSKIDLSSVPTDWETTGISLIDKTMLNILESLSTRILEIAKGRRVLILARDGEFIYDALSSILLAAQGATAQGAKAQGALAQSSRSEKIPQKDKDKEKEKKNEEKVKKEESKIKKGEKEEKKVQLFNLSRKLSYNSTPEQLIAYLKLHGVNATKIIEGKQRILLIDTGYRGSIYIRLINVLISLINPNDPLWKQKTKNVILGLEGKLITSQKEDTKQKVFVSIDEMQEFNYPHICNMIQTNLYFDEILTSSQITNLGIPELKSIRSKMIIDRFEHQPHFQGTALFLETNGSQIIAFDEERKNPSIALAIQYRIIKYFANASTNFSHKEDLNKAPTNCSKEANSWKPNIKEKEIIISPKGLKIQIIGPGGEGRRGLVYKGIIREIGCLIQDDLKIGQMVAVKIPKVYDTETLCSFLEEKEKQKALQNNKIYHAPIFEVGDDYVIKLWIPGNLGCQWINTWIKRGMKPSDPQLNEIIQIIKYLSLKGYYIGDLNANNMIWDTNAKKWCVIDCGSTTLMTPEEARERYVRKIGLRWTKKHSKKVQNIFTSILNKATKN